MDKQEDNRIAEIEARGRRRRLEMEYRRAHTKFKKNEKSLKSQGFLQGIAVALRIVYDMDDMSMQKIADAPSLRKNIGVSK